MKLGNIVVDAVFPPIPTRSYDYSAYVEGTLTGSDSDIVGHGATEKEAIEDLQEQIEEAS